MFDDILGRQEDIVVLRDGRIVSSFYKVFQGVPGIKEAQVIQNTYDRFTIFLVVDTSFSSIQQDMLLNNIKLRYGDVHVNFQFVERIDRTRAGKFRFVISEVNRNR